MRPARSRLKHIHRACRKCQRIYRAWIDANSGRVVGNETRECPDCAGYWRGYEQQG